MNSDNFEKKGAVVITGSSTGIGRACALFLDRKGYQVFAGVRKKEDGDSLKQESTDKLTPILIDVTDNDVISRAVEIVEKSVGNDGLAGLINNAGVPEICPLEYFPLDQLRKQLHVNLLGHIVVTQAFLPLIRRRPGRIINVGSIGGIQPIPFSSPYDIAKAGFHSFNDSLRIELLFWGIPVILIVPGHIATPLWEKWKPMKEDLSKTLPKAGSELYGSMIDSFFDFLINEGKKGGTPPEAVAKVIAEALRAKRPKTRYVVGWDARLQSLTATIAPDRIRDRLVLKLLGLTK